MCACLVLASAAHAEIQAPDAWVTAKVKLLLFVAPGAPAANVDVDTVDGRVTLHGIVDSEEEKTRAGDVAHGVDGAHHVRNLLQVLPPGDRANVHAADSGVAQSVSETLSADPMLAQSDIEVASVNHGVVLLSGVAQSLGDTRRAVALAARTHGVRRVASEIASPDVLGDARVWHADRYNASAEGSADGRDRWITRTVRMLLIANTRIAGFDIDVDTEDGVVTLFGLVDSQPLKNAAGREVLKVDGVRALVNELQVVPPTQHREVAARDASIDAAVDKRLSSNERLRMSDIDVDVANGIVHVTGSVESPNDHVTALATVRSTPGVRGLLDDLEVANPPLSSTR